MNGNDIEMLDQKLDNLVVLHGIEREQRQARDQRLDTDLEALTMLGNDNKDAIASMQATLGSYKGFVGGAMFIMSAMWAALLFFKGSLAKLIGLGP